jgi:hypothetical protein
MPDKGDSQTEYQLYEEDLDLEITQTTTANIATTANSKDIDGKNAKKGLEKTNHAVCPRTTILAPNLLNGQKQWNKNGQYN